MTENKTKPTEVNVVEFLNAIEHPQKRVDSFVLLALMQEITGEEPCLWGGNMIGFGSYHYKYASGHEGDSFITGFSPRKQNLTLYLSLGGPSEQYEDLLTRLGKHKRGGGCLYINKLSDVDVTVLRELVRETSAQKRASSQSNTQ